MLINNSKTEARMSKRERETLTRATGVAPTGVDPVTFRFSVERSTN